ncbi:MAG: glycosyltransferase family 39 protein, partial [Desulfomonilaceae bacterium]
SYFFLTGTAAGLAMLSKYTGVLILPAILFWLLLSKRYRHILTKKEPWMGVMIAALLALPIIWWNYQNDWASFKHILFIGSAYKGFWRRVSDGVGYQLAQLLTISPLFYCALIGAIFSSIVSEYRNHNEEKLLLLMMGTPLLLFTVLAFKGHAEANWAVMGYLSTGILTVMALLDHRDITTQFISKRFGVRRFVSIATILAVLSVFVITIHVWVGLVPAFFEKHLGKADRIVWETRGWNGLGKYLKGQIKKDDVVAADTYQLCALLEFNIPGQPNVRYLAPWDRPTQFDVWNKSYDDLMGKDILFVSAKPLVPTSPTLMTIYENFSSVERLAPYKVMYHGECIREIYICRGHSFNPFNPRRLGPRSLFYWDQPQ